MFYCVAYLCKIFSLKYRLNLILRRPLLWIVFAVSGMIGKSAVHPETYYCMHNIPDSKVHGTNIGLTWVLSAPDGPHVGPMKLAVRDTIYYILYYTCPLFVRKSQSPTCSQILWREARPTMLIKMIFIGCYRDQIYTTTHLLLWVGWKN